MRFRSAIFCPSTRARSSARRRVGIFTFFDGSEGTCVYLGYTGGATVYRAAPLVSPPAGPSCPTASSGSASRSRGRSQATSAGDGLIHEHCQSVRQPTRPRRGSFFFYELIIFIHIWASKGPRSCLNLQIPGCNRRASKPNSNRKGCSEAHKGLSLPARSGPSLFTLGGLILASFSIVTSHGICQRGNTFVAPLRIENCNVVR
jgi:hypothetical protein